ncbi:MAG TPA: glutathione S-transferase [Hyphomonadaceae bacterium]|jgi:glutathione S-transferase|nr:glutathione S-transferase [Hyphomonadaceae bacterium]
MITVHHLNNSRSQRVLWLLEELNVPYEISRYFRNEQTMLAPASLKEIHPLGKSPVISDGDRTIAETGAIIEYIVERYGNGRLIPGPGTDDRIRFSYWMHYAEGSAMTPLLLKLIFMRMPDNAPWLLKPIVRSIARQGEARLADPQIATHLTYIDTELAKHEWFAGRDFTAADIMMSFPLEAASVRAHAKSKPMIKAFLEKIHARPAYQTALKKGGPYDYAN